MSLRQRLAKKNNPRGKVFTHVPMDFEYDDLEAVTLPEGRTYQTPDGQKLPSMTTVLSLLSRDSIAAWRKRVGDEEADRISHRASVRGSAFHDLCEAYVDNKEDYTEGFGSDIIGYFNNIKPILDANVDNVRAQEVALYSNYLGVAGRVDLVAEYQGKLSIIDYKTSKRPKTKDKIHNYFMQESGYAIMWEERYKQPITQLVTIMHVDDDEPRVFIEHRDNWASQLLDVIAQYRQENGLYG